MNDECDENIVQLTAIILSFDKNRKCRISRIRIRGSHQRRLTVSPSTFNAEFIDTIDARGRAINKSGWYL